MQRVPFCVTRMVQADNNMRKMTSFATMSVTLVTMEDALLLLFPIRCNATSYPLWCILPRFLFPYKRALAMQLQHCPWIVTQRCAKFLFHSCIQHPDLHHSEPPSSSGVKMCTCMYNFSHTQRHMKFLSFLYLSR